MKRLYCLCGQAVFFENTRCLNCQRALGYDPERRAIVDLDNPRYRACANYRDAAICNWVVSADDNESLCRSCRLTRTTPNLSVPANKGRWAILETAKRRLIYNLLYFDLPIDADPAGQYPALAFDFLEDRGSNPLVAEEYIRTGYATGCITINVSEANPVQREYTRSLMNEDYRTPLGHMRHESGHYFYDRIIAQGPWRSRFDALFGDPCLDYEQALANYYAEPPLLGASSGYISQYAQAHPLEDWAECWAHFLHISDTLESARASQTIVFQETLSEIPHWVDQWVQLSVTLNELNHCMGHADAYPFVLTTGVITKLEFIRQVVDQLSPN